MKIVVFGATGRTGRAVVRAALDHGHDVAAFVRDPGGLGEDPDSVEILNGDVLDPGSVSRAVRGCDAVVCALGSSNLKNPTIRTNGTAVILDAMKVEEVRRLVAVSVFGLGDSAAQMTLLSRLLVGTILRATMKDHEGQERLIRSSDTEWTIVRPGGIQPGDYDGSYKAGIEKDIRSGTVKVGNLAEFILRVLEENLYIRQEPVVS